MADGELGLAMALEGLRDELESAWRSSANRRVRLRASEITLTVQTVVRSERDGAGKIRWYLVEAGGGAKSGSERTHTLTLTLMPMRYDEQGESQPLDVRGHQSGPDQ